MAIEKDLPLSSRKRAASSGSTQSSAPITLNEAITLGFLVRQGWSKHYLLTLKGQQPETLARAIQSGRLDASRSRIKHPDTGEWMALTEAASSSLVNLESGEMLCEGVYISLADAMLQGLISDLVPSQEDRMVFEEALERGVVNVVQNSAKNPRTGETTTIEAAINSGWLEQPQTEIKMHLIQPTHSPNKKLAKISVVCSLSLYYLCFHPSELSSKVNTKQVNACYNSGTLTYSSLLTCLLSFLCKIRY